MTTKFQGRRPLYVLPPWCVKPPLIPLPPGPYTPIVLFATATMAWPLPGGSWDTWSRSFQRIPKVGPNRWEADSDVGGDVIHLLADLDPTHHTITVQLLARTGPTFHSTGNFTARPYPVDPYWRVTVTDPNVRIPAQAWSRATLWV